VDLRPGVAAVLATQATHLSHSSRVTSTSTSISVRTSSSSTRGSFLSSRSSTVRITSREENNISVRATRHSTAPVQGGSRACFHCGEQGHWANRCPKKAAQQQPAPNALVRQNAMQQGGNNRGQPRAQYGKVNHLEADTVQETPGVALGMFSVQ
jgi:hypothetical protein